MRRFVAGCTAALAFLCEGAAAAGIDPHALVQADTNHLDRLKTDGSSDASDAGATATRIRRATVGLEGEVGKSLAWEVGYDLQSRNFRDVYATMRVGDRHAFTAGQFKQPVFMDELSSSRTADFIASSTIADALAALRTFGTPVQWQDGFVHLGASFASTRSPGPVEYRVRPNADLLSLRLVQASTDSTCAQCDTRVAILGAPEVALVRGPWKFQSEMARVRARQLIHCRDGEHRGRAGRLRLAALDAWRSALVVSRRADRNAKAANRCIPVAAGVALRLDRS